MMTLGYTLRFLEMSRTLPFLMTSVLVLAACTSEAPTEKDSSSSQGAEPAPTAQIADSPVREEGTATLCKLISPEDVSAAFGGKIQVTDIDAANEVNCLYNLGLATGEALEAAQLIVHKVQPAMYETEKENWEGKDNYEALGGVGREAYVLNQAQVNVLVDDDTALRVGLMLITIGSEPPLTQDEAKSGVIELAKALAENV